jgi:RNA polymerase sigma-70 factor (ECF subfamily)
VEPELSTPFPDHELIEQIQAQQTWAFELLFERYEQAIRRHLIHIVRDDAAVEDLLQETFLRVWTRAGQWNGQGAFKGWLFRIATNLALNHLRTRKRRPEQPLDIPESPLDEDEQPDTPGWLVDTASLGPDAVMEQSEQSARLRQIIHDLPEEKRELLRLVHQMELSLRDAADELGIPEGTAKSRLYYAREQVKRELQADKE